MLTLLFWNVGRRAIEDRVARLARHHAADILILAECQSAGAVLRKLNSGPALALYFPCETTSRLSVFTRFPAARLKPVDEARYFTIRQLDGVRGLREPTLIVGAHLPSKLEDEPGQPADAAQLARAIATAEDRLGHTRTVLLGDLNMNPFEVGVTSGAGLHGVMTRDIARNGSRKVRERRYRYFYNPMWRFFGDGTPGPAGSYFYRKSNELCYFWNIFDQAMIRPALLDHFPEDGVEILHTDDGRQTLLAANGRPDRDRASDHLPILLRLDI